MKHLLPIVALVALLVTGCATTKHSDLSAFYAHPPRSIVVAPVLNNSPEITAPAIFTPSLGISLAERGYYVFPMYFTATVFLDQGLSEAGHIHALPPRQFFDIFGADAVLFVTITEWSSKYVGIQGSVTVAAEYVLKDTRTGTVLWSGEQKIVKSEGGLSAEGAIKALMTAAIVPYKPLAIQANTQAFAPPLGIPAGPYLKDEHGKDQDKFKP
ncbi:MAG: GNA1162 family protein [bacterium]